MGVRHDDGLALLTAAAAPVLDQVDVEVGRAAEHRHHHYNHHHNHYNNHLLNTVMRWDSSVMLEIRGGNSVSNWNIR